MGVPPAMLSIKNPWLIAFGLVAVVQLVSIALGLPPANFVIWFVAPLLAVWVWRVGGPRLLVLALVFCWVGDVLGNPRLIGIGPIGLYLSIAAFAVTNFLLVILFVRSGAFGSRPTAVSGHLRQRAGVAVLYLVLAAAGLTLIWGNLGPALRAVASVYLALIVTTATAGFFLNTRAGVGAGLLFGSHLLVALEVGGRIDGAQTTFRLAVLTLYMLGIFLIALGVADRGARAESRPGGGPDHRSSSPG